MTHRTLVRKAEEQDLLDVLLLIKQFHKTTPSYYGTFNSAKMKANLEGLATSDNTVVFVLEKDNSIIGFLVGMWSEHLFSDSRVASELGFFIEEDHRGGRAFLKLIKAYEEWAKEQSCDCICMSDITEIQTLETLYSRFGYSKAETSYIKEL